MLASVLEWRGIGKMDKVIIKRSEENMKKQVNLKETAGHEFNTVM